MNDMTRVQAVTPRRTRGKNRGRLTLMMRPDLTIEFQGQAESVDQVIEVTEQLLGQLKSFRKLGYRLRTIVAMFQDQCEAMKPTG